MGFFSNLWSGVKSVGRKIGSGIKSIGKKIHDVGSPILRGIGKGYNFVKKIPVIGGIVSNSPVGASIDYGLKQANRVVNTAGKIGEGDVMGAAKATGYF